MSPSTLERSLQAVSPRLSRPLRTTRFDFSKRRAGLRQTTAQSPLESSYLSYLRATLPPAWSSDAPHIRLIADHLDAVTSGEIDRLAVFMPPRHAKTETITVRYPVHRMLLDRGIQICVTGYNERFARRLGRKTRGLAQLAGIVGVGGDTSKAADEWHTAEGGYMLTRGVGSPPTGVGFNLVVIDDPIRRREDAESEVYREAVWDWYTDDLYTRLEPGGAIVLVMTRWHEDDLSARVMASEPGRWCVLSLPAFAEENDPLGRAEGAALWPDRYPADALARIRDVMAQNEGLRSWDALYQQRPSAREGSFFKVGKLQLVDAAPPGLPACRAWDMAATPNSGDYTAGVRWDGPDADGVYYVTDIVRGQWATDDRNAMIRETAECDGLNVWQRFPVDPGSAGIDAARIWTRMLAGARVVTRRVTGSKEVRAEPMSAQINEGNVRMVRAKWNAAFVSELRGFPLGAHDDQVDASADAFAELTRKRVARAY